MVLGKISLADVQWSLLPFDCVTYSELPRYQRLAQLVSCSMCSLSIDCSMHPAACLSITLMPHRLVCCCNKCLCPFDNQLLLLGPQKMNCMWNFQRWKLSLLIFSTLTISFTSESLIPMLSYLFFSHKKTAPCFQNVKTASLNHHSLENQENIKWRKSTSPLI